MTQQRRGVFRMGVKGDVGWPSEEQEVTFKGLALELVPETETLAPSIVVRLDGTRSQDEVRRMLQEFLSGLVWARDLPAAETFSTFSTGAPLGVGKGANLRMINDSIVEYVPAPQDDKAKLALAIYREARSVNMIPYEFLGYFKVLNVIHDKGKEQKSWIRQAVGMLTDLRAKERLLEISNSGEDVGDYLYVSGRCAVAHAFNDPIVNPDDPADVGRLYRDLPVIKELARYAIEHELGVQSESTVWKEHLYELVGFREMFGPGIVARLKAGEGVSPDECTIPDRLSLRLQGQGQLASLCDLDARVVAVENGVAQVSLRESNSRLRALLLLCFQEERLVFNALDHVKVTDDGTVEADHCMIDYLTFLKGWMANGVTEVWSGGVRLGRTEPVMLVNMRPDWDAMDAEIQELRTRVKQRQQAPEEGESS